MNEYKFKKMLYAFRMSENGKKAHRPNYDTNDDKKDYTKVTFP